MVQGIGAIGGINGNNNCFKDPEYIKIMQELLQLGIAPTGNKAADKAKLEAEKQKLAQKIMQEVQDKQPVQNDEAAQRSQMEVQKLGAMQVSELMILFHQIKK